MPKPILTNGHGARQDIFESGTTQHHQIGTRGFLPDGRVFYYTRNGTTTALTNYELLVAAEVVDNHQEETVAAAADITAGKLTVTANIGATDAGVGVYEEGYFVVTDGTGQGQVLKIRDFPGGSASTDITVTLYDEVQTSAGGSTTFSLVENLHSNPQQSNIDQADALVGVPLVTIAAADTAATATARAVNPTYGWVQTWGPAAMLFDEAVAAGVAVTIGSSVVGTVEAADAAGEPIVGNVISAGVDTEYQLVDLRIRP
jgi:hypothetical protein